jgi:hypothetical protein
VIRPSALLAVTLAALAAVPAAGAATVTRKKAIWGPVERNGVSQFPIYADLGAGIFQYTLRWDTVAPARPARPADPADPAYRWPAELDTAVREGARYGMRVAVTLMGAPRWANGDRPANWAPVRPSDFATFAAAASRRYPRVHHWLIWGEPTKARNFRPLAPDHGRPLHGRGLRGPRRYAGILDAAYAALKRVSRRNLVIGGNTYTVGTVAPLHFIRALRLPSGRPPRMDLWGHNPFSLRAPDLARRPLGHGVADFDDLDTLVRALDRAMRHAPLRRERRLRVFISEYTLPTGHPNVEFNFHVTEATQARWIARALRIVRGWRRLYTFGYQGLYDDPVRPGHDQVERGLLRRDGTRKPAYAAFRDG